MLAQALALAAARAAALDAVPRRGGRAARRRRPACTSSRWRSSRSRRARPRSRPAATRSRGAVDAAPARVPARHRAPTARATATGSARRGRPRRRSPKSRPRLAASLDDVILRRGSTRRMDASASVPREALAFSLAAAMRGIDVPHFVAVHAVDGLEPGLYRWPDLATPLRRGDLPRRAAARLLGPGPRPRRRLRRDRRRRPRHARRPRLPRGAARRRARRGPAPPRRLRARRSAPPA